MKFKNNLDERQEEELKKIEKNGCWLAFWGLLAAILVQTVMNVGDFSKIVGEWIVFMVLTIYLLSATSKRGIWDRHFKPDLKTNLIFSAITGFICGLFVFAASCVNSPEFKLIALQIAIVTAVIVAIVAFAFLSFCAHVVKKKAEALEKEPEEEEYDEEYDEEDGYTRMAAEE